ncbi:MAG TPA: efflux RND transporter periplasmic adaptor subunit [Steroidobacteraceae bacterium]|nr:efflux RND transporter periplasmic adaptor subunit [Steroidobacteraceae bacterium]
MHPPALRPTRADTLARLGLLFTLLGAPLLRADEEPPAPAASALVQVVPLQQGSLPSVVTLYGKAEASTLSRQSIMAQSSAQVSAVDVRLGQAVAANTALLQLTPTPATEATYKQARSALSVAQQGLERTRSLLTQHLATVQQLNDAEKAEGDARAALNALQTQGAGGPLTLRAPFAAVVTSLPVSVGMIVNEGTALLELARSRALVLQAGAVPEVARNIQVGNAATINPIGSSQSLPGKVLLRGAVVDAASGLVPIDISAPADALLPGEQAAVTIRTGAARGYVVPHEAILLNDEGNPYVVQVIGGAAKKVDVRVLAMQGGRDVIDGALTASAPVALSGNYQLEDGMKVRIAGGSGRAAP